MKLGVNIDHIAVLREAREIASPSLIDALGVVHTTQADQITIHLREDRRHIQDDDLSDILRHSHLPINLECGNNQEIIEIVLSHQPHRATLVPENRQEVTTEGGLDLKGHKKALQQTLSKLNEAQIETSVFIDPCLDMVKLAKELDANWVEFHTGHYANIFAMLYSNLPHTTHSIKALELPRKELKSLLHNEIEKIKTASAFAKEMGLKVAAGHGLNCHNLDAIVKIDEIEELNIGQSIIADAIFVGLKASIEKTIRAINEAKNCS